MSPPPSSARRHIDHHNITTKNSLPQSLLFFILLIASPTLVLASSLFAPTCAAEHIPLAYVNKGGNSEPKPLMRAVSYMICVGACTGIVLISLLMKHHSHSNQTIPVDVSREESQGNGGQAG